MNKPLSKNLQNIYMNKTAVEGKLFYKHTACKVTYSNWNLHMQIEKFNKSNI